MNEKVFDKHNWNPQLFSSADSINSFLKNNGIAEKKIKRINTIGIAANLDNENHVTVMRKALLDVGIPWDDIDSDGFPYLDSTLLPCEVELCEPVVIVFDDDSTLEIKPTFGHQLLMSINQIDSDIVNGVNASNYDAEILFKDVKGSSLEDARVELFRSIIQSEFESSEEDIKTVYLFDLSETEEDLTLYFEHDGGGWFRFGLYKTDWSTCFFCEKYKVPFRVFKESAYDNLQIQIVEGHGGGGFFSILPVRHVEVTKDCWRGIKEHRAEELSIDDGDVSAYLGYFLKKYFDSDYPYGSARDEFDNGFEWYSTYNFYTYDTMNKMLDEMEEVIHLLATDFENEKLKPLIARFDSLDFLPESIIVSRINSEEPFTKEEEAEIIRENIYIAIDFYTRFVRLMRSMMEHSPEYDLISFMGP